MIEHGSPARGRDPLPALAATVIGAITVAPWALGYASLGATAWSADLLAGVSLIALGVRARHAGHRQTRPGPRPARPRDATCSTTTRTGGCGRVR